MREPAICEKHGVFTPTQEGCCPACWAEPQPDQTWWLSFAKKGGPCSVIVVDAPSFGMAHVLVSVLGINPGGELLGFRIPPGTPEHGLPRNRVLSSEELESVGAKTIDDPGIPAGDPDVFRGKA